MSVTLYMDHNVPRAITVGLRLRGVDVITALEDEASTLSDTMLLDRAMTMGRILFTRDDDLIAEAVTRQRSNRRFHGVVYAHQMHVSIGRCIADLVIISEAANPCDVVNEVIFLPL